jgi:hypothetical protein
MTNRILTPFLLTVSMLLVWSCAKDEEPQYLVDAPLQQYFDRFAAEAALRNVTIDYNALMISGDIRIIAAQNVIGQCVHTEKEPNTVIVDKFYWDSADDLEREFLVFHELGHCALNRPHLDDSDAHGDCVSMMTSGTGLCHINYTAATRTALLDELFKP